MALAAKKRQPYRKCALQATAKRQRLRVHIFKNKENMSPSFCYGEISNDLRNEPSFFSNIHNEPCGNVHCEQIKNCGEPKKIIWLNLLYIYIFFIIVWN